jgi:hypothetical protein
MESLSLIEAHLWLNESLKPFGVDTNKRGMIGRLVIAFFSVTSRAKWIHLIMLVA